MVTAPGRLCVCQRVLVLAQSLYVRLSVCHMLSDKFVGEIFSERELTFTFAICYRPSVCRMSVVCRLSSVVCL